ATRQALSLLSMTIPLTKPSTMGIPDSRSTGLGAPPHCQTPNLLSSTYGLTTQKALYPTLRLITIIRREDPTEINQVGTPVQTDGAYHLCLRLHWATGLTGMI